jgi:hypothetical protein
MEEEGIIIIIAVLLNAALARDKRGKSEYPQM